MRPLVRRSALVVAAIYLAVTLPLVGLLVRSQYFRAVTAAELARKASHVRPLEAVFCGDSLTAAVPNWGAQLGLGPISTLNLAVPGLRAAQVEDQVRRAIGMNTQRVIVMAGTNDLTDERTDDQRILADWEAILALAPASGQPRMIVISIPLQGDTALDERIDGLNGKLRTAAERRGCAFLDLNAKFRAASAGRGELFPDGRHFSALAYRLWSEELQQLFASPITAPTLH